MKARPDANSVKQLTKSRLWAHPQQVRQASEGILMFGPVDCPGWKLVTPRILRSFGESQESASHMSTSQSVTGHLPSSSLSLASAPTSRPHTAQSHLRQPKLPCFRHPERLGSSSLCLPSSAPTLSVHPEAAVHGPVLTPFVVGLVCFWFSLQPRGPNPRPRIVGRDTHQSARLLSAGILPPNSSFSTQSPL